MALAITIESGDGAGKRFEVTGAVGTIGRDASCAVILNDPTKHVSRVHATINERDGAYFLTINSKVNHVLVNGRPFRFGQTTQIQSGDQIGLPPFELRVAQTSSAPSSPPAAASAAASRVEPRLAGIAPSAAVPAYTGAPKPGAKDWFAPGTDFSRTAVIDPLGMADLQRRAGLLPPKVSADPFAAETPKPQSAHQLVSGVGSSGPTDLSISAILPRPASPLMDMMQAGAFTPLGAPSEFGPSAGVSSIDAFLGGAGSSGADPLGLGNLLGGLSGPSTSGGSGGLSSGILGLGGGNSPKPLSVSPGASPLVDFGGHARASGGMSADHVHDVNLPFAAPPLPAYPLSAPPLSAPPTSAPAPAAPWPTAKSEAIASGSASRPPGRSTTGPAGPREIDDFLAGLDSTSQPKKTPAPAPVAIRPFAAGDEDDSAFFDLSLPLPDAAARALTAIPAAPASAVTPSGPLAPDPLAALNDIFAEDTFPGIQARPAALPAAPPVVQTFTASVAASPTPVAQPMPSFAGIHPAAAAEPTAPPGDAARAASTALLDAFLDGIGLQHLQLKPGEEEAFMRLAGEITRSSVAGIINLLVARSEVKKELRAEDRTMLSSQDNNPLKLMADPSEALSYLFDARERAFGKFLPPVQAVDDACADIRAHEMGLVAGTRAAVEGAFKRFSPAQLEPQLAKNIKGGLLTNRNAKLWEAYLAYYEKLDADMVDHLDRLFERDFLRAYTTQVKKLK